MPNTTKKTRPASPYLFQIHQDRRKLAEHVCDGCCLGRGNMAEIAGLVLGGIPLVVGALKMLCVAFKTFHRDDLEIHTFRTGIFLQCRPLENTLERMGLPADATRDALEARIRLAFSDRQIELLSVFNCIHEVTQELRTGLHLDVLKETEAS